MTYSGVPTSSVSFLRVHALFVRQLSKLILLSPNQRVSHFIFEWVKRFEIFGKYAYISFSMILYMVSQKFCNILEVRILCFFHNISVSQKFCNILVVRILCFFHNTSVSQKFCNILVVRILCFFHNISVSQKFCNILEVRIFCFFHNTSVSQKFCNILVVRIYGFFYYTRVIKVLHYFGCMY